MSERERGWWYPYIFLGMLGLVVVVNGALAYFATSTFNGLVAENAYEKGNSFNKSLAAARDQADMGWTVDATLTPGASGHGAEIAISFKNKEGKALDGLDVQALADRPNIAGVERRIVFTPKGNGQYAAQVDFPQAGQWDVDFLASGDGTTYQMLRRFVIP